MLPELCKGLKVINTYTGRAIIDVDTETISVSQGITFLSSKVDINDVQVTSSTVEDVVVGLYKEYKI